MAKLDETEKPLTLCPPDLDNKLRFFWRMGEIPPQTEFKQLNAEPVIPEAFPEWKDVMNTWGGLIIGLMFFANVVSCCPCSDRANRC